MKLDDETLYYIMFFENKANKTKSGALRLHSDWLGSTRAVSKPLSSSLLALLLPMTNLYAIKMKQKKTSWNFNPQKSGERAHDRLSRTVGR